MISNVHQFFIYWHHTSIFPFPPLLTGSHLYQLSTAPPQQHPEGFNMQYWRCPFVVICLGEPWKAFALPETDMNLHRAREARQGDEGMKGRMKKNKRLKLNKAEFKISVDEYISIRWYCIMSSARFKEKWLPMRGSAQGVAAQQETWLIFCIWTDKDSVIQMTKLFVHSVSLCCYI